MEHGEELEDIIFTKSHQNPTWVWSGAEPLMEAIIAGCFPDLDAVTRGDELGHLYYNST